MSNPLNEAAFETSICEYLAEHGWLYSPNDEGYDKDLALFPQDLFDFVAETQPDTWARLVDPAGSSRTRTNQQAALLRGVVAQLDHEDPRVGGTLTTLRNGYTHPTKGKVHLSYPRPLTDKNPDAAAQYAATRLRVMRQVHFNPKSYESVDLVLFANGLPVATVELKTDMTQTVKDAEEQYRKRNPRSTPLFGHGTRAIVHFAVSDRHVRMTTHLRGGATHFLPFDLGHADGAGNPPHPHGSDTSYLWERVLQRDAWLGILQKFAFTERLPVADDRGRTKYARRVIFPRFHQWEAVTRILGDAAEHGAGQKYLVEHSAGSGKTNTIAWSAHQLLRLHRDGQKVFDSVVLVTDRTVLDSQLQRAVLAIEAKPGTVVAVDAKAMHAAGVTSKSQLVKDTLVRGNQIIVVTLQTFPSVLEALKDDPALAGRRYAVIADEAHSSQTGSSAAKLRRVLTPGEQANLADGGEIDAEAVLTAELAATGPADNISFLAFTATPKEKTLELFGRPGEKRDENGEAVPESFHRYPMKQAIEEGFILDVLKNYTTYQTAFQLAREAEDGTLTLMAGTPSPADDVDQDAAAVQLRRWVKLHPETIAQKVEIIVEHFRANVAHLLGGQAKAMVVTDSRAAALRYKRAMDAYLAERVGVPGYGFGTLVAFSGEVEDPAAPGEMLTERAANPGVHADLAAALDSDAYAVMIAANKYQTGFDQPKLSALYVDKKLTDVLAVQTLSRLNRTMTGKSKTFVLDFVNTEEQILEAFKPYYTGAELSAVTDPARLQELLAKLDACGLYTPEELDAFVEAMVVGERDQKLKGLLNPVVARFSLEVADAREQADKHRFDELAIQRKDVRTYVKLYDFLAQIYRFEGTAYLRRALYLKALDRVLPSVQEGAESVDISDVRLVGIRQDEMGTSDLELKGGKELTPSDGAGSGLVRDRQRGPLDEVIERLNEAWVAAGYPVRDAENLTRRTVDLVVEDDRIRAQARDNAEDQFVTGDDVAGAIKIAMWELLQNQAGMNEFFNREGDAQRAMNELLAKAVWRTVHGEVTGAVDVGQSPAPSVFVDEEGAVGSAFFREAGRQARVGRLAGETRTSQ